jgi:hypothetical protein
MWSAPCPVLGDRIMNTHFDKTHVFSTGSDPSLYNESLFVARGLRELQLGVLNL